MHAVSAHTPYNTTITSKADVSNPKVAFWRFDDCGGVLKYDAWIPNLNGWIEANLGFPISNPGLQVNTIQGICRSTQLLCVDGNSQWKDYDECVTALTAKPYGNYDEAWGDNIVCRTIHLVLAGVRPEVRFPFSFPSLVM